MTEECHMLATYIKGLNNNIKSEMIKLNPKLINEAQTKAEDIQQSIKIKAPEDDVNKVALAIMSQQNGGAKHCHSGHERQISFICR